MFRCPMKNGQLVPSAHADVCYSNKQCPLLLPDSLTYFVVFYSMIYVFPIYLRVGNREEKLGSIFINILYYMIHQNIIVICPM